jgi:hypothetical protein
VLSLCAVTSSESYEYPVAPGVGNEVAFVHWRCQHLIESSQAERVFLCEALTRLRVSSSHSRLPTALCTTYRVMLLRFVELESACSISSRTRTSCCLVPRDCKHQRRIKERSRWSTVSVSSVVSRDARNVRSVATINTTANRKASTRKEVSAMNTNW